MKRNSLLIKWYENIPIGNFRAITEYYTVVIYKPFISGGLLYGNKGRFDYAAIPIDHIMQLQAGYIYNI